MTLLDVVLYGDAKSTRGLIETFAGTRFTSDPAALPRSVVRATTGSMFSRNTLPARGRVYDLETIPRKVEEDFLGCTTGVKMRWAQGVSFNLAGCYIPEIR